MSTPSTAFLMPSFGSLKCFLSPCVRTITAYTLRAWEKMRGTQSEQTLGSIEQVSNLSEIDNQSLIVTECRCFGNDIED